MQTQTLDYVTRIQQANTTSIMDHFDKDCMNKIKSGKLNYETKKTPTFKGEIYTFTFIRETGHDMITNINIVVPDVSGIDYYNWLQKVSIKIGGRDIDTFRNDIERSISYKLFNTFIKYDGHHYTIPLSLSTKCIMIGLLAYNRCEIEIEVNEKWNDGDIEIHGDVYFIDFNEMMKRQNQNDLQEFRFKQRDSLSIEHRKHSEIVKIKPNESTFYVGDRYIFAMTIVETKNFCIDDIKKLTLWGHDRRNDKVLYERDNPDYNDRIIYNDKVKGLFVSLTGDLKDPYKMSTGSSFMFYIERDNKNKYVEMQVNLIGYNIHNTFNGLGGNYWLFD